MAFDEVAVIAKEFCREIIGHAEPRYPQHQGRRDREIHVYGSDGKSVRVRFNFMDLNEVMREAKQWCDRRTKERVFQWEKVNDKAADASVWSDHRVVFELLYNNFETMEFYASVWSRCGGIMSRAYKSNTPTKAIMRACLNAKRVLDGATYDEANNDNPTRDRDPA